MTTTYCGFITIVGRPNVGKSTFINHLLGEKICITSPKPQTTRHQIRGIKTYDHHQFVFIDTPGLHQDNQHQLNQLMNKASLRSLQDDINAVIFVIEAMQWLPEDEWVLEKIKHVKKPVILLINKTDRVKDKDQLLPFIEKMGKYYPFAEIIPISALYEKNLVKLFSSIQPFLPASPFYFSEDNITDQHQSMRLSEIVREKLMRTLEQELPYAITVEIEQIQHEEKRVCVAALIWVEREGQKAIVIGKGGKVLKNVGIAARKDMQKILNKPVNLKLWVKVKENWSDDLKALRQLGYE
ncbi:MAG: GTPase Era [Legionellales bacterium]|nr:GTPase Era [Legionellales bacterium]